MSYSPASCQFFILRHALTMKNVIEFILEFLSVNNLKNIYAYDFENGTGDVRVIWD
jgi:hypothetical protein